MQSRTSTSPRRNSVIARNGDSLPPKVEASALADADLDELENTTVRMTVAPPPQENRG